MYKDTELSHFPSYFLPYRPLTYWMVEEKQNQFCLLNLTQSDKQSLYMILTWADKIPSLFAYFLSPNCFFQDGHWLLRGWGKEGSRSLLEAGRGKYQFPTHKPLCSLMQWMIGTVWSLQPCNESLCRHQMINLVGVLWLWSCPVITPAKLAPPWHLLVSCNPWDLTVALFWSQVEWSSHQ